jgi:hypothetical protein
MEHYLVWLCGFLSWYYFSQIRQLPCLCTRIILSCFKFDVANYLLNNIEYGFPLKWISFLYECFFYFLR